MRSLSLSAVVVAVLICSTASAYASPYNYPAAPPGAVVEDYNGPPLAHPSL